MYTYVKKFGNQILVRETNNGLKRIQKDDFRVFYEKSGGEYQSISGKPLAPLHFDSVKSANKFIVNAVNTQSMSLYGAKNLGYGYIRDKYSNMEPAKTADLYIASIDIETGRDEKGYSSVEEARCPITAITLEDMNNDFYHVWGWGPGSFISMEKNVNYQHYESEEHMLLDFIDYIRGRYPDVITGWNSNRYDIPYTIHRIKVLFPEAADELINQLSPFGRVYDRELEDMYGKMYTIYDLVGISCLDYMDLFKKFTFITPENYRLDTIAHLILDDRKLNYDDYKNLQDLRDRNYQLFVEYNIKDVSIIHRLDKRLRLFDLVLSVAYKAGVNYNDVVSPVNTWDVLIYNFLMDKKIVPPISMPLAVAKKYVGAFVKEPHPNMYKWVLSVDLNSLYPHIQMGWNISPEKRLRESELSPELLQIRKDLGTAVQGIERLLNHKVDISALKKYDVTLTPNGQFYKRDDDGFIPVILEGIYNERRSVKGSMLKDEQAMENDKSLDYSDQIAAKNTLQMALKVLMNAQYGALANKHFRYFEVRNAEGITSSGQLAIQWVAKHLNTFLNRIIGSDDFDYVIAIDTDSVYLNLEKLVDKFVKTDDIDRIVGILSGWSTEILEPEINRIYEDLALYINAHKQKMIMGREVIADRGLWTGKKRYALNVYDKEGVRYAKPKAKIMGLECVRSSTPEISRDMIKDSIEIILRGSEGDLQDYIFGARQKFFNDTYTNVAFPRGVNGIEKWNNNGVPRKSCPIHVRGAIVYNNFIKERNIVDGEYIQSGDKIKFVYLKQPNIFKSPVISFPSMLPKDVHDQLIECVDYERQWDGTFFNPVEGYCEVMDWQAEKRYSVFD